MKGLSIDHANQLVSARRRHGLFRSIQQLHQLTALPCHAIRRLAEADAFGSFGVNRRHALWQALSLTDDEAPLFEGEDAPKQESPVALPAMPMVQEVVTDYATAGLSLKQHPIALLRPVLSRHGIITSQTLSQLPNGRRVSVAGLVLIRQRPGTAAGIVFETLEDETGVVNLIIWPTVYDRYHAAARHARIVNAEGHVQREGKVIHVIVKRLRDLSNLLDGYELGSRDFH